MAGEAVTTISVLGNEIGGLLVSTLTPAHFLMLIVIIAVTVLLWKYGSLLLKPKKTNCATCFQLINIHHDIRSKKIFELQSSVLKDQIEYAELVMSTIKTKIIEIYRKEVGKHQNDPQRQKDEVVMYTALVEFQQERAMDWVRLRLKANHIEEKTEEEFSEYCKEVVSKLISDTRTNMEAIWIQFFSVPRSEINKIIDSLQIDFYNDVRQIFAHAQKVAKEKRHEIEKTNEEYENEMKDILKKARSGDL